MPADGSFVFRGFVSPDGNNWKQIRTEIHMPIGAHALAGMAVTRTPTHRTIICRMASFKWPSEVGFEPLLSLAKEPALLTEGAVPESSNGAVSKMPSLRGTEGSNPVPSSGESPANRDRGRSWGEGAMMWISAVSLSFATAGAYSRR